MCAALRAKELEAAGSRQGPAHTQPADAPANQSSNSLLSPKEKYCAICTPLGKLHPNEFPGSQEWDEDSKEKEGNGQDKGKDNFSAYSDWDTDLEEQDRKNHEIKDKRTWKKKYPKIAPHPCPLLNLLFSPLNPPSSSSHKMSSETPAEEKKQTRDPHNNIRTSKFKNSIRN